MKVSASDRKLPALSVGLSMICCAVSVPLIFAVGDVDRRRVAPTTVTRLASARARAEIDDAGVVQADVRRRSRTTVPKPVSAAVTLYPPIGRNGAM